MPRLGIRFAASIVATGLFGIGWNVAVPVALGNIGEAWLGAFLIQRLLGQRAITGSIASMLLAAAAVAILAPISARSNSISRRRS